MTITQPFDEGMTMLEKYNHVQEWLKDLEGMGFKEIELTLFKLDKETGFYLEKIDHNTGGGDAFTEAVGYNITAKA